ncbi:hypothetical protein LSH36_643g01023 [Paralvinella palmiformis]|uniref:Methyltransferase FkbM domain-containing protein n=1 Tax=Paralvinella palmiformis TaxID=53620 RepID=A0AAD9MUJ1_9ANNE|nr:hypothetical protein LSH36_643g01023 [Paralvinella palmiformis]
MYYTPKIHFYPLGLYGSDTNITINNGSVPVRTLASLIEVAGDKGKVIDYLKFDIEGSEWKAIPEMAQSGILKKYVKQIAFESHTYYGGSVGHIYLNAVKNLQKSGFRKWHSHLNVENMYRPKDATRHYSYCQEMYYLNINFMKRNKLIHN